mmetsp:Transcript_56000/g.93292  ORF Transcript_56000/g.93292 Transcript_56000/m.93292 type:complete len:293 (-) Transcript_56000:2324-3202(-)
MLFFLVKVLVLVLLIVIILLLLLLIIIAIVFINDAERVFVCRARVFNRSDLFGNELQVIETPHVWSNKLKHILDPPLNVQRRGKIQSDELLKVQQEAIASRFQFAFAQVSATRLQQHAAETDAKVDGVDRDRLNVVRDEEVERIKDHLTVHRFVRVQIAQKLAVREAPLLLRKIFFFESDSHLLTHTVHNQRRDGMVAIEALDDGGNTLNLLKVDLGNVKQALHHKLHVLLLAPRQFAQFAQNRLLIVLVQNAVQELLHVLLPRRQFLRVLLNTGRQLRRFTRVQRVDDVLR